MWSGDLWRQNFNVSSSNFLIISATSKNCYADGVTGEPLSESRCEPMSPTDRPFTPAMSKRVVGGEAKEAERMKGAGDVTDSGRKSMVDILMERSRQAWRQNQNESASGSSSGAPRSSVRAEGSTSDVVDLTSDSRKKASVTGASPIPGTVPALVPGQPSKLTAAFMGTSAEVNVPGRSRESTLTPQRTIFEAAKIATMKAAADYERRREEALKMLHERHKGSVALMQGKPPSARPRPGEKRKAEVGDDEDLAVFEYRDAVDAAVATAEEEEEEDDDERIYAPYQPKHVADGCPHPDPIVQTSSLAHADPPPVTYDHHLSDIVTAGGLSGLQVESVVYANMQFDGQRCDGKPDGPRQGFFLGDGAGVGKGRQIAANIIEHWRQGRRRILWVSVSQDLKVDSERDINDLTQCTMDLRLRDIRVYPEGTSSLPKGKLSRNLASQGVIFCTYSLLIQSLGTRWGKGDNQGIEVLIRSVDPSSRLAQLIQWLGDEAAGPLIVFDECHKAKNMSAGMAQGLQSTNAAGPQKKHTSTKTALAVVVLQAAVPQARVIYASATGASEPAHLGYMSRLALWGPNPIISPFAHFKEFLDTVGEKSGHGMGTMELFAMGMKSQGKYLSRQLSYEGAEFRLHECKVSEEAQATYDRAALFWQMLHNVIREVLTRSDVPSGTRKGRWSSVFWGAHQRFFRQLLMHAKLDELVSEAQKAVLEDGRTVVIGLQSTGEANVTKATENMSALDMEEMEEFVSAPKVVLQNLVDHLFPLELLDSSELFVGSALDTLFCQVQECVGVWKRTSLNRLSREGLLAAVDPKSLKMRSLDSDDDEDAIEMTAAKGVDELEAEKLEQAKLSGGFIDLDAPVTLEQVAKADRLLKESVKEREAVALAAAAQAAATAAAEQAAADEEARRAAEKVTTNQAAAKAARAAALTKISHTHQQRPTRIGSHLSLDATGAGDESRMALESNSDGESDLFEVEYVYDHKVDESGERLFKVRWLGYSANDDTWEPEENLGEAIYLAHEYEERISAGLPGIPAGEKVASPSPDTASIDENPTGVPVPLNKTSSVPVVSSVSTQALGSSPAGPVGVVGTAQTKSSERVGGASADPIQYVDIDSGSDLEVQQPMDVIVIDSSSDEDDTLMPAAPVRVKGERQLSNSGSAVPKFERTGVKGESSVGARTMGRGAHAPDAGPPPPTFLRHKRLEQVKELLLHAINDLTLPANPLDDLIDRLGGRSKVAEMTGRRGCLIRNDETGKIELKPRNILARNETGGRPVPLKQLNLHEKKMFMDGEKHFAIISEAASSGISLQADRRVLNQRRRVHFTLELPWSAEKAVQQFGRSHRSNQTSVPIFVILMTDLGGERRFASAAAKRLQSLGALLRGDRQDLGAGKALKSFDIDNSYGKDALNRFYRTILRDEEPFPGVSYAVPPEREEVFSLTPAQLRDRENTRKRLFFDRAGEVLKSVGIFERQKDPYARYMSGTPVARLSLSPGFSNGPVRVDKFLNRLLGLTIKDQMDVFNYFCDLLQAYIGKARSNGDYDEGIVSLKPFGGVKLAEEIILHEDKKSHSETSVLVLELDRGMSWDLADSYLKRAREDAVEVRERLSRDGEVSGSARRFGSRNGFYLSHYKRLGRPLVLLVTEIVRSNVTSTRKFRAYRPNIGAVEALEEQDLNNNYILCEDMTKVKAEWTQWWNYAENSCIHVKDEMGRCKRVEVGEICRVGARRQLQYLISGAVLPIWPLIAWALPKKERRNEKGDIIGYFTDFRIARAMVSDGTTSDGRRIVGLDMGGRTVNIDKIRNKLKQHGGDASKAVEEVARASRARAGYSVTPSRVEEGEDDYLGLR